VAEDDSKRGVVRGPPTARIRPPWWAVLAVSVSLLALVAAATSGHSNPTGGRAAAPDHAANPHQSGSTALPPTTTTTTEPAAGPSTVTPPNLPPSSPATTSPTEAARVVARHTSDTTTTTTAAPTTTTTAAAGVSSLAAAVQPVAPITMSGALQQPDDASASYPFTGVGSTEVSASSTSSAPLLLTVTCPSGALDEAGSSFVSVVIPDADGPCELVLKETEVQYVAVPYTVTIGPEGG
jgi:hypothetical protein